MCCERHLLTKCVGETLSKIETLQLICFLGLFSQRYRNKFVEYKLVGVNIPVVTHLACVLSVQIVGL